MEIVLTVFWMLGGIWFWLYDRSLNDSKIDKRGILALIICLVLGWFSWVAVLSVELEEK